MDQKIIVLPSKEVMLERLIKVDDNSHLRERFYSKLIKHAGEQMTAMGVVVMIETEMVNYADGLPEVLWRVLHPKTPVFANALITDDEVANEARQFFDAAMSFADK